jgi:L-ascorbate metabolism protein UlaG (beta-lactamase superfamily)
VCEVFREDIASFFEEVMSQDSEPVHRSAGAGAAGSAPAGGAVNGTLTFVGTATTIIRFGELTLLTDPNFPHQGQLSVADLPELDAILLSHLHGDHWDRVAHRGLDRDLPVLTTTHAGRRLQLRVYISGDTLLVDELNEIPVRFPDIDTGVLHLGGTTLPGGLVVTMDARQGADAVGLIGAGTNIPIHYGDYPVFRSSLSEFRDEVDRRGLASRVRYVDPGDTVPLGRPR